MEVFNREKMLSRWRSRAHNVKNWAFTCTENISSYPNHWNMKKPRQVFYSSLLLLFLLPFSIGNIEIITSEQSLHDGVLLLSRGRSFALGFFSPPGYSFKYLGIWYFKLPDQMVVWVANRGAPINDSSGVLSINAHGNLDLNDRSRQLLLWSTNALAAPTNGNCVAELLDTGNLVLRDDDNQGIVWQSFDYPSDTLLPGMKLGWDLKHALNRSLTSWKSPSDPGIGEYSLRLDNRDLLQLFLYRGSTPIWRSAPWVGAGWMIPMTTSNYSFVHSEDERYFTYTLNDPSVITRNVVTNNGLLKRLTWHDIDRQWKAEYSAPTPNCDEYKQCGDYGICDPNTEDPFKCGCLPGFQPRSPQDWYLKDGSDGCVKKRPADACGVGEGFLVVRKVKIPDASRARVDKGLNPKACKEVCLRDCSCTAFANEGPKGANSSCMTFYGELIDTVEYAAVGRDLYVRVDKIELANARKSKGLLKRKGGLPILILSSAGALFILVMFAYFYLMSRREARDSLSEEDGLEDSGRHPDLVFLSLSSIVAATNNFSSFNKLGQGGFGSVYKGQLSNGQEIAVKRLSKSSGQGIKEFKNEVRLIAKLQHRNLVKILGSCMQREEQMLVYEYLPNKSLDFFIFDQTRRSLLDWGKRSEIIVGIARGILYLHQDSRLRIIHRDLKPSNILLDAEMNPKISDFGMARIFDGDQAQDKTQRVVGTYGYMSPEYAMFGKFSTKSDVFSFGVILLEIISGKKSAYYFDGEPSLTLIRHVWDLWREERALEILDPSLKESHHPVEVLRCIHIGLLCVEESVMDRPTMLEVVLMLVGEASLPLPHQPAFAFWRDCNRGQEPVSINEVTITRVEAR